MSSSLAVRNSADVCAATVEGGQGVNWWAVAGWSAVGVGALGLTAAIAYHYGEEAGKAEVESEDLEAAREIARLKGIKI